MFDGSGNAFAVWQQDDGTVNSIYSNRYVAGTGWATAELLEMNIGDAEAPQVAFDGTVISQETVGHPRQN